MSPSRPSLDRPRHDYRNCVDFVNLAGGLEAFDPSGSVGLKASGDEDVWYGRGETDRAHEVLYRIAGGRWVLVFVIPPGHEDAPGPHPTDRELTPVQAARWLRLNEMACPDGLTPASLDDLDERKAGQARLDRGWRPSSRAPQPVPVEGAGAEPAREARPSVILDGPRGNPIVLGKEKPPLSRPRYDALKALIDAGRSLSRRELDHRSGHTDARKPLRALADSDPDWRAVISFPAAHGGGYAILDR